MFPNAVRRQVQRYALASLSRSNLVFAQNARTITPCATSLMVTPLNQFSTSSPVYKKASKKGASNAKSKAKEEPVDDIDSVVDFAEVEKKMQHAIDAFKERAAVIKQGNYTIEAIEEIPVPIGHHKEPAKSGHGKKDVIVTEPIKSLARVASKGPKTITITVFDPASIKRIISAIIAANLNLNPLPDPKQPDQVLRLSLPPQTSEIKQEIIKNLKAEYDHFRASPAKRSLTSVREDVMKHLKKANLSKDDSFATKDKLEKLFKTYSTKLQDTLKTVESSILKG